MEDKTLVELLDILQKVHGKIFEQEERLKNLEKFLPAATFTYETMKELQTIVSSETNRQEPVVEKQASLQERLATFKAPFNTYVLMGLVIGLCAGTGFLLVKYLLLQGFVQPMVQSMSVALAATLCLVGAEYTRTHNRLLAQVLATLSSGFYWLSFLGTASPGLLSESSIIGGGILLAASSFAITWRYAAPSALLLNLIATYTMPFIVSSPPLVVLPSLLLVGLSSFVYAFFKQWKVTAVYALAILGFYSIEAAFRSTSFMMVYGGLFFALGTLLPYYALLKRHVSPLFNVLVLAATGVTSFGFFYFHCIVSKMHGKELMHSVQDAQYLCLLFGIFYTLCAAYAFFVSTSVRALTATVSILAVSFYTGFCILYFEPKTLMFVLQGYALLLFALSFITRERSLRVFSFFLWVTSLFQLISQFGYHTHVGAFFYYHTTSALGVIFGVLAGTALVAHTYKRQLSYQEAYMPEILEAGAAATLLYWFHTPFWNVPSNIICIGTYGLLGTIGGCWYRRPLIVALSIVALTEACYSFAAYYIQVFSLAAIPSLTCLFSVFSGIFFVMQYFFSKVYLHKTLFLVTGMRLALFTTLFFWLRMYVLVGIDYSLISVYKALGDQFSLFVLPEGSKSLLVTYGLTVYYGLVACILLGINVFYQNILIRFGGFCFLAYTLFRFSWIMWSLICTMNILLATLTK